MKPSGLSEKKMAMPCYLRQQKRVFKFFNAEFMRIQYECVKIYVYFFSSVYIALQKLERNEVLYIRQRYAPILDFHHSESSSFLL
jgi:hypothetical protein